MQIIEDRCSGCGICVPYCPMNAIALVEGKASIDLDKCVECNSCLRTVRCPEKAFRVSKLTWPRTVAAGLSNPITEIAETRLAGRGTEEMKTNEVTGRFQPGFVGIAVDVGRPNVGTLLSDVERIAISLARHGVTFEPKNPVTSLMKDPATGYFQDDVKSVRVLTAVLEALAPIEKLPEIVATLREVAREVNTVFSVNLISVVETDYVLPLVKILEDIGVEWRPNGKTNLGLGRRGE